MKLENKTQNYSLLHLILMTFLLISCAPGLGTSLHITPVNESESKALKDGFGDVPVRLHVLPFSDSRAVEAIAQIDGRVIKPEGDLGALVQDVVERSLKKSGVSLSLFNSGAVRGAIKEWRVYVNPGFPTSSLNAVASISIELIDPDNHIVHKAVYSGTFTKEHPFLGEDSIVDGLNSAMGYAIEEFLADPQFINKLSTMPTDSSRPIG